MKRPHFVVLSVLPLGLLAACADMPMDVSMPVAMPALPPPTPVAPVPAPDTSRAQFIAQQRAEARRVEGIGALTRARQHWRYVLAMSPDDAEARQQIPRLDALIRTRRDAALAQGETAMMRGQTAQAQTAFLRVLALDGANEQARRRLLELETRAAFARQDRKDMRARVARTAGMESPDDER
jgi:hypothetical protein